MKMTWTRDGFFNGVEPGQAEAHAEALGRKAGTANPKQGVLAVLAPFGGTRLGLP